MAHSRRAADGHDGQLFKDHLTFAHFGEEFWSEKLLRRAAATTPGAVVVG
jgi:hypothetical protein